MDKKESKPKINFFQKLKSIKHIDKIIAVLFIAILLVVYVSTFTNDDSNNAVTSLTTEEYAKMLEDKMSSVLSNINGAGDVSVMVTLECGIEYIYATTKEEITTTSGSNSKTTITEELVMVSSSGKSTPVIIKENLPKISGVLVVAEGAGSVSVKLEILKAVQALFELPADSIEILIGK